MIAPKVPY